MKYLIFAFSILFFLTFTACEKESLKDDKEAYKLCTWDASKVSDTTIWKEFVVEPLVTDPNCNCITSGILKYVKKDASGKLTDYAFMLKYVEKGPCDVWGYIIDCNHKDDWKKEKDGAKDKDEKDKSKDEKGDDKSTDKGDDTKEGKEEDKAKSDKDKDCDICKFQVDCTTIS